LTVGFAYSQNNPEVLIMGGLNNEEFLGCLTCAYTDQESVWNDLSRHGWGNGFGTWNSFGPNKSPFSSTSACNEFASSPPKLVDRRGNYYGYLTINEFKQGSVCAITGVEQICIALRVMCSRD
jgi:hypothetical protein